MLMSVAPVMIQRNVEDCPFAMVRGSAVKLAITGLPPVSRGSAIGFDGGTGGGGGGTFFLHPAAKTRSASAIIMAIRFHKCDLILSVIPSPLISNQYYWRLQTGFSLLPAVVSCFFPE